MSKQNVEGEAVVPIPTSFEVNHDEQWAADHSELGDRTKFVAHAISDDSEIGTLLKQYSHGNEEERAMKPPATILPGVELPVEAELIPFDTSLVFSVEDDEDEMMTVVEDIGNEIINVMVEETFGVNMAAVGETIAAATSFTHRIEEMNDDATALIFPHQDIREEELCDKEETPPQPMDVSVSEGSANSNFSKDVFKKMKSKYNMNDEVNSSQEESRNPYDHLDDDGVWSPFLLVCGGLRECFDNANEIVTESVFPHDSDDYSATSEEQEEAANQAARMAMNDILNEPKCQQKKKFKLKFKGGQKMKNLFRRKRNTNECEMLY